MTETPKKKKSHSRIYLTVTFLLSAVLILLGRDRNFKLNPSPETETERSVAACLPLFVASFTIVRNRHLAGGIMHNRVKLEKESAAEEHRRKTLLHPVYHG
jgi:hypothetical protein